MKIAYMFAGQGAQYPGMGKELADHLPQVAEWYHEAGECLSFSISEICFTENGRLNETKYTQPAVLATGLAALMALETKWQQKPDYTLGLSLGEYGALTAAGAFTYPEALKLVYKRGRLMQEAAPQGIGGMAAVMGLSREAVADCCREAQQEGHVYPANYNMPGQVVISGEVAVVEKAGQLALAKGAKRVIPLEVSGPFHTCMLDKAAEALKKELDTVTIRPMNIPVVTNVTATVMEEGQVAQSLVKQIVSPVLWEDSIRFLIARGVTHFVELGPGRTLSTFVRKIDREIQVCNVENMASLEKTVDALKAATS